MIIDCRNWKNLPDGGRSLRRRVFIDGVEDKQVWYVSVDEVTGNGFIKTYNVLGDGKKHVAWDAPNYVTIFGETFEEVDGLLSCTVEGRIELKPLE